MLSWEYWVPSWKYPGDSWKGPTSVGRNALNPSCYVRERETALHLLLQLESRAARREATSSIQGGAGSSPAPSPRPFR